MALMYFSEMSQFSVSVGAQFDIISWLPDRYQWQCKQHTHLLAIELDKVHAHACTYNVHTIMACMLTHTHTHTHTHTQDQSYSKS